MKDPLVAALCLTRDRPEMLQRAVRSFRSQTYQNKVLFILDSGKQPCGLRADHNETVWYVLQVNDKPVEQVSIGELRNLALGMMDVTPLGKPDIFVHFDDDDWSGPQRIAEQVALLQASGADAVGYSDLLFWDSRKYVGRRDRNSETQVLEIPGYPYANQGESVEGYVNEAYLFSRPSRLNVPGTTLMYWRQTWERKTFPHLPEVGNSQSACEDICWQSGLEIKAVSSVRDDARLQLLKRYLMQDGYEARMVASIHGGNTQMLGYSINLHNPAGPYRRVPEWDSFCKTVMAL